MTAGHDGIGLGSHHHGMNPATRPGDSNAAPLICSGRIHLERGAPEVITLVAETPRSRVAYMEDGAVFCAACALELARTGDGVP